MTTPYCLLDEAWIPILRESGHRELVRPRDLTTATAHGPILRIATGRPDCDISLTEFLIGLLAVTLGPESNREWAERYRAPPTAEDLEAALRPFERALLLDGDGPRFFQDLENLDGEPVSISGLMIEAPGGNTVKENADHFVKRGGTSILSRHGATLALLTLQTMAPSGGAGHRTSLRGGGPLTTLVVPTPHGKPATLWQRLWANVPGALRAAESDHARLFPWLAKTRVSDKTGVETTPEDVHAAQAFFGMPRRIRLVFEENTEKRRCDLTGLVDEVVVTSYVTRPWGTNYVRWSKGHPLSPYYRQKKTDLEFLPLHLQSSRIGYRQWLGLAYDDSDELRVPAKVVTDFYVKRYAELPRSERPHLRLLAAGYAMDNMKPLDFAEATMPLIVTGSAETDNELRDVAHRFVDAAEEAANQLVRAVRLALYGEKGKADNSSTVLEPVRSRFWADTEDPFFATLHDVARRHEAPPRDSDDAGRAIFDASAQAWIKTLRHHALTIFDETVPIDSAESGGITDLIKARKALVLMFDGRPPYAKALFNALDQPLKETKSKKEKKERATA